MWIKIKEGVICDHLFTFALACFVLRGSGFCTASTLQSADKKSPQPPGFPQTHETETSDVRIAFPHTIREILTSIDEKLRGLDAFSYTLKLARLDFSLEQLSRRLESIESKLGRLETKFDVRMEKVEEVVVGKDIKEDISKEQLSRRIDNLNEKVNNRAAFLDAKLEMRMDRITNKIELLERDIQDGNEDIMEKLEKSEDQHSRLEENLTKEIRRIEPLGGLVRNLDSYLKDDLSQLIKRRFESTDSAISQECGKASRNLQHMDSDQKRSNANLSREIANISETIQTIKNKLDNGTSSCLRGYSDLNRRNIDDRRQVYPPTREQVDNLTDLVHQALSLGEAQFKEIDSDVERYTRKVVNSIYELRKSTDDIKSNLLETAEQGNRTRVLVREEFRKLQEQIEPLPLIEPKLSFLSDDLDKKVTELSSTVDNSFATLLIAQNTFISSCRRIQEEEVQLYSILEHVIYEMRNRSLSDTQRISEELSEYNRDFTEKLGEVVSSIFIVGNQTKEQMRHLASNSELRRTRTVPGYVKWKDVIRLCSKRGSPNVIAQESNDDEYPTVATDEQWLGDKVETGDFNITEYEYDGSDYS